MSYSVYLVAYMGGPMDHHAIFVETQPDDPESGCIFQVIGDIQQGMRYGHKKARNPEKSATYLLKTYLGMVFEINYGRMQAVVETVPPPPKQLSRGRRINPEEPLRRCQKWTADAIRALRDAGVLEVGAVREDGVET
jgi:hypothetical protein